MESDGKGKDNVGQDNCNHDDPDDNIAARMMPKISAFFVVELTPSKLASRPNFLWLKLT